MTAEPFAPPCKLVRVHELVERTGLHRTTIWRLRKAGAFPAPVRIADRLIAWREEDIATWIAGLPDAA